MESICVVAASSVERSTVNKIKHILNCKEVDLQEISSLKNTILVSIGGDGFLLRVLHKIYLSQGVRVYGLNFGTYGFLLNHNNSLETLYYRIESSVPTYVSPVSIEATDASGKQTSCIAFNEVALIRSGTQTLNINIYIDDKLRLESLISDGVLVSTACGSTGYNFSVMGPIFSTDTNMLSIRPISPFRPRYWRGALISDRKRIKIILEKSQTRSGNLSYDFLSIPQVEKVLISSSTTSACLLFNKDETLADKILNEQFAL